MLLSIFIPVYNEHGTLPQVLERVTVDVPRGTMDEARSHVR